MATQVGSLYYDLDLNDSGFKSGLQNADSSLKTFGDKMTAMGSKMRNTGKALTLGFTLPVAGAFGFAIKSASDLNETMNKVDVAFGTSSDAVKQWSQTSIQSMGLAQQSALDATALFGDMGTSMGLSQGSASEMSMSLTQLGADLASFKNIGFEQAQTALAGVFTGETESLKRLGIVMTQTQLDAFALEQGMSKTTKEMSQAELVSLRYAFVMDKTKNAQGDFARTSDGTANRMRMAQEQFKELSATVGEQLLPIANKVLAWLSSMAEKFSALSPTQQKVILLITGLLAILPPLIFIFGTLATAIGAISTALAFLSANPVVLIIIAIIAVIAGLAFLIIKNWDTLKQWFGTFVDTVKNFFTGLWDKIKELFNKGVEWVKNNWDLMLGILTGGLGILVVLVARNWDKITGFIRNAIDTAKSFVSNGISSIVSWFTSLPSKITGAIGNMGSLLYDKGKDLINGLINGAGSLLSNIGNFFLDKIPSWIKTPFKKALGISSPSRVFAEYGKNTMQGLQQGIKRNAGMVQSAIGRVGNDLNVNFGVATNARANVSGALAGNTGAQVVQINVNPSGIVARTRSELRDITKDMISTVDDELRAKGKKTILGGL